MTDITDPGGTVVEGAQGGEIVTLEQATAYFVIRYGVGTKWTDLSDPNGTALLRTSERDLLVYYSLDADDETHRNAVCEQAFMRLCDAAVDRRAGVQAQGVKSAGMVKEVYSADATGVSICSYARGILGEPITGAAWVDLDELEE